ncbi:MAG: tetratricopeptide repeat protein [Planctomycetaceae bacterium]
MPHRALFLPIWLAALLAACSSAPKAPPDRLLALGKEWASQKRWNRARLHFDALVKRHPAAVEVEEAQFLIAEMRRFAQQGASAFEAYKRFIERYPTSRFCVAAAEAEFALGVQYLEGRMPGFLFFPPDRGQGVKILGHMQANFANHSLADDALVRSGDYLMGNGEHKEAAEAYRSLLAEYPRSEYGLGARRSLAMALWRQSEGAAYDERILLQAARAFQDYVEVARLRNSEAEAESGRVADAEARIQGILEQLAEKQVLVARLYERRNQPRSAAFYYEYCVRQYPGTEHARLAAERLSRLGAREAG